MKRTEDQTELDEGLIRIFVEAPMIGVPSTDEPRWYWFHRRGVVMRFTASDKGATRLVDAERSQDYSYWAIMRDQAGRVAWSTMHLAADAEIPEP